MNGIYELTESLGAILAGMLLGYFSALALSVAMYILQALGLYTIADRRRIKHPWLAWLPLTNMWILGSIGDQYQYVAKGQIRNRRKVLLGIGIAMSVLTLILVGCYVSVFVNLFANLRLFGYMTENQIMKLVMAPLLSMAGVSIVALVLAVIATVFQYIAYYDLFASCNPKYKVLFTVLGILFPVTLPFFVFACRNKDVGMPPRKVAAAPIPEQPVTETPKEEPLAEE